MLAPCSRPGYTVYCNKLMSLRQCVATRDRTWYGHTIETSILHLLGEFLMKVFVTGARRRKCYHEENAHD